MKNNKKPFVSVIINCFNGEKFLDKCLKSVLSQSYKNYEIIFFDNNSKDNSLNLVLKLKSKKIKIFKSKKKLKLYHARNLAISRSKGKFISILDVDDTWHKDKLKIQVKKIINENSDIVYSNYFVIDWLIKIFSNKKLPIKNMTFEILKSYPICISTVLFKKKIFLNLRGFDSSYEIIGDYDFFYRASKKYKFSVSQKPLVNYLIHNENTTKKRLNLRVNEMKKWIKINYESKYRNQFDNIYQKNLFFECTHHITNRNIKKFYKSLKSIPEIKIKFKLIFKLIYFSLFK